MLWLNRLQQRLSLTKNEAVALLCLSGLLAAGLAARHVQQQSVPAGAYDEMDRMFFERSDSSTAGFRMNGPADLPTAPGLADASDAVPTGTGRIDINTADAAALDRLPRIGPKTAERILTFRATYGPFLDVDDLRQIRGIGEKTVELLRAHVYVAPDSLQP